MNIALIGKLGSGKSTAARALVGHVRHSWADGVRDIFSMAYDPITPENYAEIKAKWYDVKNTLGLQRTGRELLQRIGTDAMRNNVDEDFWLRVGLRKIGNVPTVNDDTRFLNEAAALRERGFKLVRVVRPGIEYLVQSAHPSETEQDRIAVDHTIVNDGTVEALAAKIRWYAGDGASALKGSHMAARWGSRVETERECNCLTEWPEHAFDCPLFHVPRS